MSHSFKQITPTDHFGWHAAYLEVYDRLFKSVGHHSLLEIGCDGGGGILSYEEYFGRQAGIMIPRQFVSCDISPEPNSFREYQSVMRTHYRMDAYTNDAVTTLSKHAPYSVMIDDGPHNIESQEWFTRNYPPLLSPDGIAIVEDIQEPAYIERLHRSLPEGFLGYAVDLRLADSRYDSLLFVIQRK